MNKEWREEYDYSGSSTRLHAKCIHCSATLYTSGLGDPNGFRNEADRTVKFHYCGPKVMLEEVKALRIAVETLVGFFGGNNDLINYIDEQRRKELETKAPRGSFSIDGIPQP